MARLTKKAINAFKGRQAEETVYGEDPAKLGPAFIASRENLMHAYNWYAQIGEVKSLRKWVEKYASVTKPFLTVVNRVKKAKDNQFSTTICAIAKMHLAGCPMPKESIDHLNKRINELVLIKEEVEVAQPIVSADMNQTIADTEDMLDEFYRSNYKNAPIDYFKYLNEKEVKPIEARGIIIYYEPLLEEVKERKDLKPKDQKAYIAFVTKILDDTLAFLTNSRKERALVKKPRKVKAKSADKIVKNVKYKASDTALKITSVPPAGMHGALYIWLYNTKYKRLTYLTASEPMTVKGTTVIGFDEKASITKTLRKPEKTLPELLNSSKVGMVKVITKLSTKAAPVNGRLNSDTVILKAGK